MYRVPEFLKHEDPEIYEAIGLELKRQEDGLELIASENYVSPAVLAAQGSILTNKYAEGLPAKRYYGGCQFVDIAENLARDRVRKLFHCDDSSAHPYHVNVQPHSGAQANMAVYTAFLNPGDTILGLDLSHGGHLTHGSPVNFSGKFFHAEHYSVEKDSEKLNYEKVREKARACKPKMLVAGASAYPHIIDFKKFAEIAKEVGAYLMVDMAHIAGLVAAGLHPSPMPHADFITSTTHKTLRGPRGGIIFSKPEHGKKIDSSVFPGMQGGPLMHVIAAKAVAFGEALKPEFTQYQKQVVQNAQSLAKAVQKHGMRLVGGGTENHLMLVDVGAQNLTGKEMENILDEIHITVNKNTIPFETRSPFITSGIRLGTPAVTSRGLVEKDMQMIAGMIAAVADDLKQQNLENRQLNASLKSKLQKQVLEICQVYPIYK